MTSRERVRLALKHVRTEKIPHDLGSTLTTGIHVSIYTNLKQALGITDGEVRVSDPFQMLAEVEEPVKRALGVDTVGIQPRMNFFGYPNENWKPFTMPDGTDVMISGHFQYDIMDNGDILQYPRGDRTVPPSGKMPKGGFFFDTIVRQEPIEDDKLDPKEWVEQTYPVFSDEDLRYLDDQSRWYYENTDYSIIGSFWGGGFSDIGVLTGPSIPYPKGIRDPEEWYLSLITRRQYIQDIFNYQFEIQMKNLGLYKQAMANRIDIITMSGTDFGAQHGPFFSPILYREMIKPLQKKMNDWVHTNTNWKVFFHSCGSIVEFLDDFIEIGVDIINPVQISAKGMSPEYLKDNYGDKLIFWGGGVDSQHTLPFGTPDEVRNEVTRNIEIFSKNGGFVFNNVHNIQANVPLNNLLAMFNALGVIKEHYF